MTLNLDNALHGVQEARTALMLESGTFNTPEQMEALESMQESLNEVEVKIKIMENEK